MRPLYFSICWLGLGTLIHAQSDVQPSFGACTFVDAQKQRECSDAAVVEFISQNLKYPALAREKGIQGTVIVRFVVNKDGSTTQHQLIRDIGGGCGEEAMRVVKLMGNWKPGMTAGNAVNAQMNLPIKFKLEAEANGAAQYSLFLGAHTSDRLTGKELAAALNAPLTARDNTGASVPIQDFTLTIEKRGKSLSAKAKGDKPTKAMQRIAKKAKKGGSALLEARVLQNGAIHTVQRSIAIQ